MNQCLGGQYVQVMHLYHSMLESIELKCEFCGEWTIKGDFKKAHSKCSSNQCAAKHCKTKPLDEVVDVQWVSFFDSQGKQVSTWVCSAVCSRLFQQEI